MNNYKYITDEFLNTLAVDFKRIDKDFITARKILALDYKRPEKTIDRWLLICRKRGLITKELV